MSEMHAAVVNERVADTSTAGVSPPRASLAAVDMAAVAESDTGSVINGFLDLVVRLAGASAGAIRVLTPNRDLRLLCSIGLTAEVRERDALMPGSCGICGAAIRDDDTRRATRTIGCSVRNADSACGGSMQCALAVPLDYQGRSIGVLNLFFAPDQDPPDCVSQLLRPFGQLLGMALENEKLGRENLQARVLSERQAMASEIHDALAQSLTFARMRMSVLEGALQQEDRADALTYCSDVNNELRFAHGRLRELITQFRAGMDSRGLIASLRETAATFFDRTGIALEFDCPLAELDLTHEQEREVYNIVQEALANVRKHAHAKRARLAIRPCNEALEFTIEDDGRGIGGPKADGEQHYGLAIMRERAERAGGCLHIDSPIAGGTRVRLLLPAACELRRRPARAPDSSTECASAR
jgi:two-component system nitrate/nitrite sensor histidine kinase NarX